MSSYIRRLDNLAGMKQEFEKEWSRLKAESDRAKFKMGLMNMALDLLKDCMCRNCKGSGSKHFEDYQRKSDCPKCGGTGMRNE